MFLKYCLGEFEDSTPSLSFSVHDIMKLVDKIGDLAFGVVAWPVIMVYLFVSGDGLGRWGGDYMATEKAIQKTMKERMEKQPRLPPPRRRSLSVESPPEPFTFQSFELLRSHSPKSSEKKKEQIQTSRLLLLPLEIREQIYIEVLGDSTLHITQLPNRLGHTRCTRPHHHLNNADPSRACFYPSYVQTYRRGEPLNKEATSDGCLSLLQTNRQIYNEASATLYQTNTFEINHPQTLLFLSRTIPTSRFSQIRHLHLSWRGRLPMLEADPDKAPDDLKTWEATWDTISYRMPGLRTLRLRMQIVEDEDTWEWSRFARERWTKDHVCFEKMLERMKCSLRGLRRFDLDVVLPAEICWDVRILEGRIRESICQKWGGA